MITIFHNLYSNCITKTLSVDDTAYLDRIA